VRAAAPLTEEREVGRGDRAKGVIGHGCSVAAKGGGGEEDGGGVVAAPGGATRASACPARLMFVAKRQLFAQSPKPIPKRKMKPHHLIFC
jgi:hypothetical protein